MTIFFNKVDLNDVKFIEDLFNTMGITFDKKDAKVIFAAIKTRTELEKIGNYKIGKYWT